MKKSIVALLNNKNFTWHMIGITLNSLYPLFLIIFVTRFNGIDDSGLFSFTFYFVALLSTISAYGGRTYQISDVKAEHAINHYISLRYVTSFIMFIVAVVILSINPYNLTKTLLIFSFLVFRAIESIADSYYGVMQKNDNLKSVGKSFVLKSTISFILFIVIDLLTKNILISSTSLVFSNLLIFIFYDRVIVKMYSKISSKLDNNVITLLKKCFPLFIFSFFQLLLLNSTRYIVDMYLSEQIQGYFGIIIAPTAMVSLLAQYLIQPFITNLSKLHHNREYVSFKKNVRKICICLLIVGVFLSLITYFIGIPVLSFIYSLNLDKYRIELTLVVVAGVFSGISLIYSTMFTILRSFKSQMYIYIISFIFTVILSLILVKSMKLEGALSAFWISMIFQSILFWLAYAYKMKKISA